MRWPGALAAEDLQQEAYMDTYMHTCMHTYMQSYIHIAYDLHTR